MDLVTLFSDQLPFQNHAKKSGMERVCKCVEILVVWSAFLSADQSWTAKVARLRERQINCQEREDCPVPVTPFQSTKWVHWWMMECNWNGQELEQQLQAGRWFWVKLTVWQPSESIRLEPWLVWDLGFGLGRSRDIQRPGNVKKSFFGGSEFAADLLSLLPSPCDHLFYMRAHIFLFRLCFSSFMVICTYFIVLSMYIYCISFVRFMLLFDFVWFLSQISEFGISVRRPRPSLQRLRASRLKAWWWNEMNSWPLPASEIWNSFWCKCRWMNHWLNSYRQIGQICVKFFGFFWKPSRMSPWQRFWCRFIVPVQRL